jgi:hypothetical protein
LHESSIGPGNPVSAEASFKGGIAMTSARIMKAAAAAALLLGLAACNDTEGTTAKEIPATEPSPAASPAAAQPTNPVTGTVPGTNTVGAAPAAPGSGGSSGAGSAGASGGT